MSKNSTVMTAVKNIVYRVVLPIYLWSIGYKTLDEYIRAIVRYESLGSQITTTRK